MMEKDQILNGKAPAWKVIVHLMDEYPDHWRISLPDVQHKPSGMVVRLSNGGSQMHIVSTGNVGMKISPWRVHAIYDAINRLVAAKLLMSSRKATLDGTDFEQQETVWAENSARITPAYLQNMQSVYAQEIMKSAGLSSGLLRGGSSASLTAKQAPKP